MSTVEPPIDLGLSNLDDISPTESIFKGVDAAGSFQFRTDLTNNHAGRWGVTDHLLRERDLIAMGLTEVCCEKGRGKVFYFPMEAEIPGTTKMAKTAREQIACSYHRLPKLVYVPFIWGEEDQTIWREMGHTDRLRLLNARAGGIPRKECVMPIDLVYEPYEKIIVRLNAYNNKDSGCKAILAIVPQAYVGWCTKLQGPSPEVNFIEKGWADGAGAFVAAQHTTLKEYQARDGDDLVQRLYNMYFDGEPRSLVKFEDIISGVIEYHSQFLGISRK